MWRYIIGIDEVGRGCLAGPVTVAAVAMPRKFKVSSLKLKVKLKDSKKHSAEQRAEIFAAIKNHPGILYARANVYPKVIDRINISNAANLAATRALKKVIELLSGELSSSAKVYLDGGLYINNPQNLELKTQNLKTIVRGDEKYNCVKLASIVAKVNRDRIISNNHRAYPEYGLAQHKGYGTKAHIAALKKYGLVKIHRVTFIKNIKL